MKTGNLCSMRKEKDGKNEITCMKNCKKDKLSY